MKHPLLLAAVIACCSATAHPCGASDWTPLFKNDSLEGWVTGRGKPVEKGWNVKDGVLECEGGHGSIFSKREYRDFELRFQWKLLAKGNSGVKYRVKHYKPGLWGRPGWLGCEYQVYDDHGRKTDDVFSAGALYGLYAPSKDKQLKPIGEYNSSRIVVRGDISQHWLNGKKVLEVDRSTDDWRRRVAKSKFAPVEEVFQNETGCIQLQDHRSRAWYKEVAIRELKPAARTKSAIVAPPKSARVAAPEAIAPRL